MTAFTTLKSIGQSVIDLVEDELDDDDEVDPVLDSYFHAKANESSNPRSSSKKSGIITNGSCDVLGVGYPPTDSNKSKNDSPLSIALTIFDAHNCNPQIPK